MIRRYRHAIVTAIFLSAAGLSQGNTTTGADNVSAADAAEAQRRLEASDNIRNPSTSFSITTSLVEYRNGKQSNSATVVVYSRLEPGKAQYRSLVRYVAPLRDAGKLTLKSGKDIWFHDPASRASVRVSPQQRVLGQASNGDVVSANFAADYQARKEGHETVQDGDRKARRSVRLHLRAKTQEAAYHNVRLWLDESSNQPIKAQFHTETGRLLKTIYYRRYQQQLGARRPTEEVIIDGLEPSWITVMRYSDFVQRDIPAAWMQRDYLPHFRPDTGPSASTSVRQATVP